MKSWLFQDQLEKPEEFVLYRPRKFGGLGLIHVESKFQALLTRSFMETAANPTFRRNHFHEALYRWHVLGVRTIVKPGLTPYYDEQFFERIKKVKEEGLLNMVTMSCSSWYRVFLENNVTHILDDNGALKYKPTRTEQNNPDSNWDQIWALASIHGLPSELSSFLWLMFHNILPTKERLFRMNMPNITSPTCDLCNLNTPDSLKHALLLCNYNNSAGTFLTDCMKLLSPNLQTEQLLQFNFEIPQEQRLPAMYIFSSVLSQIWSCRKSRKVCSMPLIRASLEAGVQILRKSRHEKASIKLEELLAAVKTHLL